MQASKDAEVLLPDRVRESVEKPFGGLLGDTAELRVLEEIVADPYTDYTQGDLVELTGLSDPSVRKGIERLVEHGIVRNVSRVRRRPVYRADPDSRKLTALTFLAYASMDGRDGTRAMDDAVRHYCDRALPRVDVITVEDHATFVDYPVISGLVVADYGGQGCVSSREA